MRRLFLPLIVLVVMIAAIVLTIRANRAANPEDPDPADAQVVATTPVLSVRRAPEWLRRPKADGLLTAAAAEVLSGDDVPEATCLVVYRDDEDLVLNGQGLVLEPGKTQRLVNLAALGQVPQTPFTTSVVRRTVDEPVEGAIPGDLFLIGGGDPVLSTDDFAAGPGAGLARTRLEDLADEAGPPRCWPMASPASRVVSSGTSRATRRSAPTKRTAPGPPATMPATRWDRCRHC